MTASAHETVALRRDEDGVVLLTLQDRANNNAFTDPFVQRIVAALGEVSEDPAAKVCVVTGLDDVFCAGAHQDLLLELAAGEVAASDIVLSKSLLDVPIPTIAAMSGHAVGGGLAFGLCCDMVFLARESRYGCSFMNMGFTPGMGTTRLVQLAVGEYRANEMMFGGQFVKGARLQSGAGVNEVLPRDRVLPRALSLARRIAEKPRHALELLKRYLSLPRRQAFEETRTVESFMHQVCFASPETARIIRENYAPAADREPKPAPEE